MIIVFCIDQNYVKYAKISIASYRKHNPQATIIIVHGKGNFTGLGEDKDIQFILPQKFRNRGEGDRITNTAYLKCFLPNILEDYHKIIYVDADTICQHPLNELWEMPCEYINLCESHKYGLKQAAAIRAKKYGLTGMMVMNLDKLREIKFTHKCLEVEHTYPTPITGWQHDETCINVAMKDKLRFIDHKFNYGHNREYTYPIPESQAVILHYVGKDKEDMFGKPRYKEIKQIGKLIRGANVAIVGNAKSLFDTEYGKEIDSHDFVIRFNRGFFAKPESQGTKTTLLLLACNLTYQEIKSYGAKFVVNRSKNYFNPTGFTLSNEERMELKGKLGSQPSTGFMAIDICLNFGAKHIDLYGFDWEKTPTWYNDPLYKTQHDYPKEQEIALDYQKKGFLTIHD